MEPEPYKRRIPRSHRRVMLVLLSDAANIGGYTIERIAGVSPTAEARAVMKLRGLGWLMTERERPTPVGRPPRTFYRLTPYGRERVMALLGLRPR